MPVVLVSLCENVIHVQVDSISQLCLELTPPPPVAGMHVDVHRNPNIQKRTTNKSNDTKGKWPRSASCINRWTWVVTKGNRSIWWRKARLFTKDNFRAVGNVLLRVHNQFTWLVFPLENVLALLGWGCQMQGNMQGRPYALSLSNGVFVW